MTENQTEQDLNALSQAELLAHLTKNVKLSSDRAKIIIEYRKVHNLNAANSSKLHDMLAEAVPRLLKDLEAQDKILELSVDILGAIADLT